MTDQPDPRVWMRNIDVMLEIDQIVLVEAIRDAAIVLAVRRNWTVDETMARLSATIDEPPATVRRMIETRAAELGADLPTLP